MSLDPAIQPNFYTCRTTYTSEGWDGKGTFSVFHKNNVILENIPFNATHIFTFWSATPERTNERLTAIQKIVEEACWRGSQNETLLPSQNPTIDAISTLSKQSRLIDISELENHNEQSKVYRLLTPKEKAALDRKHQIDGIAGNLHAAIWPTSLGEGHGCSDEQYNLWVNMTALIQQKARTLCPPEKDPDALARLNEIFDPYKAYTTVSPVCPAYDRAQAFINQAKHLVYQEELQRRIQLLPSI